MLTGSRSLWGQTRGSRVWSRILVIFFTTPWLTSATPEAAGMRLLTTADAVDGLAGPTVTLPRLLCPGVGGGGAVTATLAAGRRATGGLGVHWRGRCISRKPRGESVLYAV